MDESDHVPSETLSMEINHLSYAALCFSPFIFFSVNIVVIHPLHTIDLEPESKCGSNIQCH